jgi:L-ribulose-5-phosphate 3-epimerase
MLISLNCSSFVAKQHGYHTDNDWGACVGAVNNFYSPVETFGERFEQLIVDAKALGYTAIDVWTPGQLSWRWATSEHIQIANDLLAKHNIQVTSLGGSFGQTHDELIAACELAVGINTRLLSGTVKALFSDRKFLIQMLEKYDLRLAIENHPEKSAQEMLDQIGDTGNGRIGTAVDTGWYATHGLNAVEAIRVLGQHVFHIHLKDVLSVGEHVNCGYGKGIVPLKDCVKVAKSIGYTGDLSIENHCFDHDPTDELREALPMVQNWWQVD